MSINSQYRHGVLIGNWQQEQYGLQLTNNQSTSINSTQKQQYKSQSQTDYIYDHTYAQSHYDKQQSRLLPFNNSPNTTLTGRLILQHDIDDNQQNSININNNRFNTTYNHTYNKLSDSTTPIPSHQTALTSHIPYTTETHSSYNNTINNKLTQTQTSDWRLHGRKPELEKQVDYAYHQLNLRK